MRSLSILSYEDKLVEAVIAEILTRVYEPRFYDFSYGFRPNRSCYNAVCEVVKDIQLHKTS